MTGTILGDGVIVHHGSWYNNAEGLWILTLTNMEANYLLAAIALYITFYSQDFWYAVRWVLHSFRYSDPNPQHVIHHQLQVALRNSGNPGSYLYKCILIWWAWRKVVAARALRRCGLEIFYSLVVFGGWILAGVFIAVVLEEVPKDVLLAADPTCGLEYKNWTLQPDEQLSWLRYREQVVESQMPRVDGCWFGNWTKAACSFYPVPKFELENEPAECPLSNHTLCTSTPIEFHVGPVRSDHDLGIDTTPEEAVVYNRVTTCSTINLEPYVTNIVVNRSVSDNDDIPLGSISKQFDIGNHIRMDGEDPITLSLVNKSSLYGYYIDSWQDGDPESSINWAPREDIFPHEGNWNLFFLRQVSLRYTSSLDDAFLRSTNPTPQRVEDPLYYKTDLFAPNDPYTSLACLTRHQFCKVDNSSCTDWMKFEHLGPLDLSPATFSPTQDIIIQRIVNQTSQFGLASVVRDLGSQALFASQSLIEDINIGSFSDRQWTTEVERWIASTLAVLQYQITFFVRGFETQVNGTAPMVQGRPELKALCGRQRVTQTGVNTRNFHFIGVLACFLVGVVVNAMSLFGSKVNDLVQRFRTSERPGKEWNQDGLFQLHRRHLELDGVVGWEGLDDEIPVVDGVVERSTCKELGGESSGVQSKEGVVMRVQETV
ncbi:hypothetical protein BDZ85DRAFT_303150 [Elsinoe ampelina]|uniref:Uncharacterized protein n=1 Tax=Elsinoe ampelina TaxID=302913 RepID=A0A6A6G4X6_9PEZI|nr:hypothetical protein BDZ85DRAFT_303150 [Elsinoe ampelina]